MSQPVIQASFNSGEWAPALYSRVDLQKYHSGAALLQNFFVDYRGGATTRPGSRYVLRTFSNGARLIPFQASFTVAYLLEFGNGYIRFYYNGAPVLEAGMNITSATNANPCFLGVPGQTYNNGDWIFVSGVNGMTQLNGNYYIVANTNHAGGNFSLTDLFGNPVNSTTFGAYTSGGQVQRVYTLPSPYVTSELFQVNYCQDVNILILCHPNHPPYALTLIAASNWTIAPISFVPTIATPTGVAVVTTAAAGGDAVAYVVTAVDINGQESIPSPASSLLSSALFGANYTNTVSFAAVTNAVSYNIYKSVISAFNSLPSGTQFGFAGNCTGVQFIDSNITPNFALTPPIINNPFSGAGVQSLTITNPGSGFGAVPTVTFSAAPLGGVTATAYAVCSINPGGSVLISGGNSYLLNDIVTIPGGVSYQVTSLGPGSSINGLSLLNPGSVAFPSSLPTGTIPLSGGHGNSASISVIWQVGQLILTNPGAGYLSTPTVTIGGGGATATATLGAPSAGNPTVPGFIQQRLFLGGPVLSPSQFNLSQPGSPFNFNITAPIQADNAIQATLTNTVLNSIKSVVPVSAGLIVLADKGAWLINGGSPGAPISALAISANAQAYSGATSLPPIVTPNDLLYVQSKGSIVRDLSYNFYLNNYVGADISTLSSHLFYGFSLIQWAWAEEPFKLAWAVRNDGQLLSLTFVKEQELIAWAHHTTNGAYTSVASVTENTSSIGFVDAVYTIVQRVIQGQIVQYIERFTELTYPYDYKSSWQVDAGIGYNGSLATTFSGAQHLGGQVVTGVADGVVINFTMPISGTFVFGPGGTTGLTSIANASIVTVGLTFTPELTTLPLDLGEPTVQGKRKKISGVSLKVNNTLGLEMCSGTISNIANAQPLQDLIIGNVNPYNNAAVTGLVFGDSRGYLDPDWSIPGQYTIIQPNPYPASVLGVVPEIEVGDTPK